MHIIIVGAGEVGRYLAEILSAEQQDVYLIERDERLANELDEKLDASVIHGSGISRASLIRAGINRADLLLAVTHIDEINLVACMTAERIAPNCRTVARVRDRRFLEGTDALRAEEYGVDMLLGPEEAVAEQVVRLLQYGGPGRVSSLADDRVLLLELPVEAHSTLTFASLEELASELPAQATVFAKIGKSGLTLTKPDSRFEVGERVLFLCAPGEVNEILRLVGSEAFHVKRVLLVGGDETGFHVARSLQKLRFDVTIFEEDPARAEELATKLTKSVIMHASGTDPTLLDEQIREGQEAVVVLLEDDEKSFLTGIIAKYSGAKKVIARVNNVEYGRVGRRIGVDALISPRRAIADAILRYVRRSQIEATITLGDNEGELLEFVVPKKPKRKLTEPAVAALKLPEQAAIIALFRQGEILVPSNAAEEIHIQPDDHVIVAALKGAMAKLEEIFD